MWYVYSKATKAIQKVCASQKAATAWRSRKHNEFVQVTFEADKGPLFEWGCAESDYFHSNIEWRAKSAS